MASSQFIEHCPCPNEECGSSDAGATYTDGTGRCHKCGHRWRIGEAGDEGRTQARGDRTRGSAHLLTTTFPVHGLPARRIDRATLQFWGYGVGNLRGEDVHVAQYRDNTGTTVAQKWRSQDKSFGWVGDASKVGLYGEWLWREGGKTLVLTEGEIDALTVSQVQGLRWPVASVPNGAGGAVKSVKASLEWVESFQKVVIMFDQDEEGRPAAEAVARLLTPGKAHVAVLQGKDPNELLQKGRPDLIERAFWDAKPWRPSGILQGDDLWERMSVPAHPPIAEYPFPELQAMTLGVRRAEIILLVAGIGGGKSTLCRSFVSSLLDQGVRVGVLPLEEAAGEFSVGLLGMRLGRNYSLTPGDSVAEDEEARRAFEEMGDLLTVYEDDGRRDAASVFDRLRYMAVGMDLPVVVLDHLTVVIGAAREDNDRRFAERVVSDLEALVKRTKVTAIVVMHLRKSGEGKSHEEGRKISMADIKGSGLIPGLAHKVIAYERDQQSEKPGRFRLLKNRPLGRLGVAGHVRYDEQTGRLVPEIGEPMEESKGKF